jgi:hypothetical protein
VYVTSLDESEYFKPAFNSSSSVSGPAYYNPAMDSKLDGYVDALDFCNFMKSFNSDWNF